MKKIKIVIHLKIIAKKDKDITPTSHEKKDFDFFNATFNNINRGGILTKIGITIFAIFNTFLIL